MPHPADNPEILSLWYRFEYPDLKNKKSLNEISVPTLMLSVLSFGCSASAANSHRISSVIGLVYDNPNLNISGLGWHDIDVISAN